MSSQTAGFIDSGLSIFGSLGGAAVIQSAQTSSIFSSFSVPLKQLNQQILFGQKTVGPFFSEIGNFKSKSLSEVVRGLRSGLISPEKVPIEFIIRNGEKISLNNRSLLVLRRAGIEPKVLIDKTGIEDYERILNWHLKNNLPSDVIRIRGGGSGSSFIGPLE
jgi:hypothetical protein